MRLPRDRVEFLSTLLAKFPLPINVGGTRAPLWSTNVTEKGGVFFSGLNARTEG